MNNEILIEIKNILEKQNLVIKDILNFEEALSYLKVSKSFLYKMTSKGEITYYKPNGKLIYFKRTDLDDWMLRNEVSGTNELEDEVDNFLKRGNHG
ncbi:excisionase family DNA binding protein [Jejuia pallidilutea]|uniref:Excisionase family DNA binding protein n=1 Tax=Jejuia pallidilutea TaxID=504487 RepID=A0A362X4R4_9FLAO|nr:helix-turn-helix domain-containing protein [Jejuia pallidilutea]PQV50284.1 excisionase family DNA binding protein [Jejuia pallidilutea]